MKRSHSEASFSLIEVVLALGIVSFAIIAILGLFSAGLKTNKESLDQIQAAHIASLLITQRRAAPTNTFNAFALPPLNNPASDTGFVGVDGTTSTTNSPLYQIYYEITPNTAVDTNVSTIHLILWPAVVDPATRAPAAIQPPIPTNNPSAYYEITTQIAL